MPLGTAACESSLPFTYRRTTSPSTLAATCTQRCKGSVTVLPKLCVPAARSGRNRNTNRPVPTSATSGVNQPGLGETVVAAVSLRPTTPSSQLCEFGTGVQRAAIVDSS